MSPISLILVVIIVSISSTNQYNIQRFPQLRSSLNQVTCTREEREKIDESVGGLIGKRPFPETPEEYRYVCNDAISAIRFGDTYTKKCMSSFGQKVASIFLYGIKNQARQLCKSGRIPKKGLELLGAAKCGNAARPGIIRCVDQFSASLMGISESSNDKLKIPMACCNYYKLKECLVTEAEEVKICTRQMIDYVERYATEALQGILDMMCYEYNEGSDTCHRILPLTPARDETIPLAKSPFMPAIDMVANMKDPEEWEE